MLRRTRLKSRILSVKYENNWFVNSEKIKKNTYCNYLTDLFDF